ncbi:tetratricopeptide (TPR) repeat protein [Flavobacterium sp. CG_9.10]|uniref:tetratricopeptide repeat protein n=1 Tax=Flavobacterium sp. CG_9.10 TaxID=2787729 RepID=UPI0018CA51B6|nr:tetratricopeptide repeat protein [Flavobacterium sp. CG_9.10]MBG6110976.1 tetratricopeptide (TPR) repeat protein [Flavobacterium sp. CG_9.10]
MKTKILLIVAVFCISKSFSQNRYSQGSTSSYKPMTSSEIMSVPLALKAKYDENQKYLYDLMNWVIELKEKINEKKYLERLEGEYSVLKSMRKDDLARATDILKDRELSIKELISEYNNFIAKHNPEKNTTQNSPKNQNTQTNNVNDLISEGLRYYNNNDYQKAIFSFSKHLQNNPNDTDVLFMRAMTKSELNDMYGAISDYDKILSLEGEVTPTTYKFSTVYNNKAYCLVNLKNYKEALPLVEKALKLDTTEWYIWDTRAEIYMNLGKLDESISDCNEALKIKENSNSYLIRGLAKIKKGEKSQGCQDLSKAGELGESKAYDAIIKYCK